jgi:hypothetical protein
MFGVYMCFFCVGAVLCLGRGLATSWSLVQEVLPIVNRSGNWKEARAHKGCRAIQEEEEEEEEEVTIDGVWIGELLYLPLMHTIRNYK